MRMYYNGAACYPYCTREKPNTEAFEKYCLHESGQENDCFGCRLYRLIEVETLAHDDKIRDYEISAGTFMVLEREESIE